MTARMTWYCAGGCVISSQVRPQKRARSVRIAFHRRGITSSVSVIYSPRVSPACQGGSLARRKQRAYAGDGRERLANGSIALEAGDIGRAGHCIRGQFVLCGDGLQIIELHFQKAEQPFLAFRACALKLSPELLNLQLQPRDEGSRAAVRDAFPGRWLL